MDGNYWSSRWSHEQIIFMLNERFQGFWQRQTGVTRERLEDLERLMGTPHNLILSGLRRVGKSTLLAQLAHKMGEERFYYLSFEDERFSGFTAEDFNFLYQHLIEVFGERQVFLLDEIQNVDGWERFVRRFQESGSKFVITGSNASLLSRELGTRLTGRYIPIDLLPFSFKEFLTFRGESPVQEAPSTTSELGSLQRSLNDYVRLGGLPDPLRYPELPLRRNLYEDVLYRDIAARYQIEDVRALMELSYFLISNPAAPVSFNKIKETMRLGSATTVRNYFEYLEKSWLIFLAYTYDYSVKRQQIAPKKVYAIDTGLVNTVGFQFSPNRGRLLENLVYLALRRNQRVIYYYASRSGYEVDFYLPEQALLIQVAQNLDQPQILEREVRSIREAMKVLPPAQGLILTEYLPQTPVSLDDGIQIRSIAEWLIHGQP